MEELNDISNEVTTVPIRSRPKQVKRPGFGTDVLLVALWFGLFTGMLEGAGLLVFQRINWRQWGVVPHVSAPILWISPVVDVIVVTSFSLLVALISWFLKRQPIQPVVSILTFLTSFDLLSITMRLN